MQALVKIVEERVVADSREVATVFGKQHQHVLRSIDKLLAKEPSLSGVQFWTAEIAQANNGAMWRAYEMDRDGFTLLAMGFTGEKALQWKLAYIRAFNEMEAALRALAANENEPPTVEAPSPRQIAAAESFGPGLQIVREARLLGGKSAGIRAWLMLGGPEVFDEAVKELADYTGEEQAEGSIVRWLNARTLREPGARTRMMELHADYERWCAETGEEARAMKVFSRNLDGLGFPRRRSDGMQRIGLKLKPTEPTA